MTSFWTSRRSWRRVSGVLEMARPSTTARASRKSESAYEVERTVVTFEDSGLEGLVAVVGGGERGPGDILSRDGRSTEALALEVMVKGSAALNPRERGQMGGGPCGIRPRNGPVLRER